MISTSGGSQKSRNSTRASQGLEPASPAGSRATSAAGPYTQTLSFQRWPTHEYQTLSGSAAAVE